MRPRLSGGHGHVALMTHPTASHHKRHHMLSICPPLTSHFSTLPCVRRTTCIFAITIVDLRGSGRPTRRDLWYSLASVSKHGSVSEKLTDAPSACHVGSQHDDVLNVSGHHDLPSGSSINAERPRVKQTASCPVSKHWSFPPHDPPT
jgi:hypothetical protein